MTVLSAVLIITSIASCVLVMLVRHRYLLITVRGMSMYPTYLDLDRVLVRRTRSVRTSGPCRGAVIVLRPPVEGLAEVSPLLLKRIAAIPGDEVPPEFRRASPVPIVPPGQLLVLGDNSRSADSRSFGLVDFRLVVGTVIRARAPREGVPVDTFGLFAAHGDGTRAILDQTGVASVCLLR
jgi:signal peptidase I